MPKSKTTRKVVRLKLKLSEPDRRECQRILRKGAAWVWRIKRAQMLLLFDEGKSRAEVARAFGVAHQTAGRVGARYLEGGLEHALSDDPRPGKARLLDLKQSSAIVAMVCSRPPEGRTRWTVRLVAQEAIKRGIVPEVGRETIRILLENHELKPWREKNVGHPGGHR
jgi:putative transposase